jgi:hypothetical protein
MPALYSTFGDDFACIRPCYLIHELLHQALLLYFEVSSGRDTGTSSRYQEPLSWYTHENLTQHHSYTMHVPERSKICEYCIADAIHLSLASFGRSAYLLALSTVGSHEGLWCSSTSSKVSLSTSIFLRIAFCSHQSTPGLLLPRGPRTWSLSLLVGLVQ